MNLLRTILNAQWAIEATAMQNLLPLAQSIVSGQSVSLEHLVTKDAAQNVNFSNVNSNLASTNPNEYVMVIPFKGVMTKYSNCGEMCYTSLERSLAIADSDIDCIGIVLDIDSPGGQASYLSNVAVAMRNFVKPIVTYYSGMCCSAAYYIASQSNEIYASIEEDTVGSIGTMMALSFNNEANSSFKELIVTASKSTNKVKRYLAAKEGETSALVKDLDVMNERFHSDVVLGRGELSSDVFDGSCFNTKEAIELNLINGQMGSVKEAIARVFTLGKQNKVSNNQNNSEMKKFEKLSSIVGREVTAENPLTESEMEMLENQPSPVASEGPVSVDMIGQIASAVSAEITPKIEALTERLETVEQRVPVAPTIDTPMSTTTGGIDYSATPWLDPNDPVNKSAENDLK